MDGGSTAVYAYDAEGRRVAKTAATAGGAFEYLFDLQGRAVTELGAGTKNVNRTEIYGGGRHLATQNKGLTTTYFTHNDWLGTERVRSSLSGTVAETCQSLPYGDVLNCSGAQASTLHFTGKMRDAETNLTEFPARYYSSMQGRWYSPDWGSAQVPVPYADLHNPQSLNLYDYVGGDPTNHADADGHLCTNPGTGCGSDQAKQAQDSNGQASAQTGGAQNTSAAAVAPVTTAPLVIDKIIVTVEAATEKAFDVSLGAIGGTIAFIFASSQKRPPRTKTQSTETLARKRTRQNRNLQPPREAKACAVARRTAVGRAM